MCHTMQRCTLEYLEYLARPFTPCMPGCIALGLYGLSRQPAQTGVIQRLVGRFACEGSCMRRIQMRGARRWVMPSPRVRI